MRLEFSFNSDKNVELPLHYNYIVQSFIYSNLSPQIADFLHEKGFPFHKRQFKLFTFSRLMGKSQRIKDKISFSPPLSLLVSSPFIIFLESLAETLIHRQSIRMGNNELFLDGINVLFTPTISNEETIKMLSPLTVYSTLLTPTGKKKTYYYNPREKEFSQLIKENLLRKHKLILGDFQGEDDFSLEPLKLRKEDEKIIKYKGIWVKGWMGIYKIRGDPELIKLGWETGLGSKNPQGFGCFDLIKERV